MNYQSDTKFINLTKTFKTIFKNINIFKPLTSRVLSKAGRSYGQIVSPRRSNFCRRNYRYIDFKRIIYPTAYGLIIYKTYDPLRTAPIGLVCFPTGLFIYILLPSKINAGSTVQHLSTSPINDGDSSQLKYIPPGSLIHNISLYPRGPGQLTRSAGCSTILIRKEKDHAVLRLKSGEMRYFHVAITGSLGTVGNESHHLRSYGKAGVIRRLGTRPRTRPSAMNPVDHPMGGRTRGGCQPMTAKGTVNTHKSTKRRYQNDIIFTKRQKKFKRF